jgi:hypothetical protein
MIACKLINNNRLFSKRHIPYPQNEGNSNFGLKQLVKKQTMS